LIILRDLVAGKALPMEAKRMELEKYWSGVPALFQAARKRLSEGFGPVAAAVVLVAFADGFALVFIICFLALPVVSFALRKADALLTSIGLITFAIIMVFGAFTW
jgi:hypothetical protein